MDTELPEDGTHLAFDRVVGDVEFIGDFPQAQGAAQCAKNSPFP
jgi:hypothetical protein